MYAQIRAYMRIWRVLLRVSATMEKLGEIQAIDGIGVDRVDESQHYANRTNYPIRSRKTTVLVDCDSILLQRIHYSLTQPPATQIGLQVLKRNPYRIEPITAAKGYDSAELRGDFRNEGVNPPSNIVCLPRYSRLLTPESTIKSTVRHPSSSQYSRRCIAGSTP